PPMVGVRSGARSSKVPTSSISEFGSDSSSSMSKSAAGPPPTMTAERLSIPSWFQRLRVAETAQRNSVIAASPPRNQPAAHTREKSLPTFAKNRAVSNMPNTNDQPPSTLLQTPSADLNATTEYSPNRRKTTG